MSYYDTGYEYGGYPVYVGTGYDEAFYEGFPPLSYVAQYHSVTERGRIEISSMDIIGHFLVYKMMDIGATYALRKGFLDAALFGYMYKGQLYGSMSMAARQQIGRGAVVGTINMARWLWSARYAFARAGYIGLGLVAYVSLHNAVMSAPYKSVSYTGSGGTVWHPGGHLSFRNPITGM